MNIQLTYLLTYIFGVMLALTVSVIVTTGIGSLLGDPKSAVEWAFPLTPFLAVGLTYLFRPK